MNTTVTKPKSKKTKPSEPKLKQFQRFVTLDELKANCQKRDWKLDTSLHDHRGHDHVNFKFKIVIRPDRIFTGRALYNVFNSRLFGELDSGEVFDAATDKHEQAAWFQQLLETCYVS